MKVFVLDNLLEDFDTYFKTVKDATYATLQSQGQNYSDMSKDVSSDIIYSAFKKRTGMETTDVVSFLRAYINRPEYRHKMWIHSDALFADYIGILMIQSSEFPQDDGVCLWFNKDLGTYYVDTKNPNTVEGKLVDSQTMDPEKWTMFRRFEFKKNRYIVFPACYFHSKAIVGNHGTNLDNARLVHVTFFNEVKNEE